MTALSTARRTLERSGDRRVFPVKAATTIHQGSMVAIDANDLAVPMSTATTLRGAGRAEDSVVNDGANGAESVTVGAGIYRFDNSAAADLISQADIGLPCYGVDDQTVAKTDGTGTRSVAGTIFDIDADGVWVKFS